MKRKLLILIAALMLTACGKTGGDVVKNENTEAKAEVSTEKANEGATFKDNVIEALEGISKKYPKSTVASDAIKELQEISEDENTITFKDDSDREVVTVKKRPKKVAILYASYASMYDELGGKIDLIIGGERAQELYKFQHGEDISEGKSVIVTSPSGKNWSVEKIIAEKPDLIICAMTSNGYGTIKEAAEVAGIDLIGISFNGVRDYAKWSYIFTSLNDNEEAFKNVALNTIDGVSKIIEEVPQKDERIVALSLMPTAKTVKGNYTVSDLGTILEDLGTVNPLSGKSEKGKSPRVDIGIEDIIKMNPEYIFIQCMDSKDYARTSVENHLSNNEAWHQLDAVKKEKVFYLPRGLFHNKPNSKYVDAYKLVFDYLYK